MFLAIALNKTIDQLKLVNSTLSQEIHNLSLENQYQWRAISSMRNEYSTREKKLLAKVSELEKQLELTRQEYERLLAQERQEYQRRLFFIVLSLVLVLIVFLMIKL